MTVWLTALVSVVLAFASEPPAVLPSAGSLPGDVSETTHGWVVLESETKPVLAHLPPRGPGRATAGAVRPAFTLDRVPEAIAAHNERVYLIDAPTPSYTGGRARSVVSLAVTPGADERWFISGGGRTLTHPALPGNDALLGFVAIETGPAALTDNAEHPLRVLIGQSWVDVTMPGPPAAERTLRLIALPDSLGLVDIRGDSARVWTVGADALRRLAGDSGSAIAPNWQSGPLTWPDGAPTPDSGVACVAGDLIWASMGDTALDLWVAQADFALPLAHIETAAETWSLVPLAGAGRVALLLHEPDADGGTELRVVEVSAFTGAVLFDGATAASSPVSRREMRLLMAVLAVLMVMVLLMVMRTDAGPGAYALPDNTALAPAGLRIAAGLVDLVLVALLVSTVRGASPLAMLNLIALLESGREADLVLMVATGFAMSTLGEWLAGRTPGKAIVGCRVVSLTGRGEDRRPTLLQAMLRNAVRWLLPPVALLGLVDPEGRHRGDTAARTVVIVDTEPSA